MELKTEHIVSFIIIFALGLMFVNAGIFPVFRTDIAIGMTIFTVAYLFYILARNKIDYPIWKSGSFVKMIILPVSILFVLWLIASSVAVSFFNDKLEFVATQSVVAPLSVLTQLSTATSSPFQSIYPALDVITFGVLIPIVETLVFFGFFYAFLRNKWFSDVKLRRLGSWLAILTIGIIFGIAHSKSYQLNDQLILTAIIFAIISGYMVEKNKTLQQIMILHIVINVILRLISLGILKF